MEEIRDSQILIVDDTPSNIKILTEALRGDYKLAAAINGIKAIEYAHENETDLILLDIMMPEMDGYEVADYLKKNERTKDIPVIFISGLSEMENMAKGFEIGAVDYITKPFEISEVKSRVRTHLELGQYRKKLEEMVKLQTRELRNTRDQLENKTLMLEEANTALRVLLKRREEDKKEMEDKMLLNIKELVLPYIEEIKLSGSLNDKQNTYTEILESNLRDVISPFLRDLSKQNLNLTQTEIRIVNLIKQGKTSKEIASLFGLAPRTIDSYRDNIRKKMGIKNKKVNMRTFIMSME